jgi:hypothetical protein
MRSLPMHRLEIAIESCAVNDAEQFADQALAWLRDHYDEFRFFTERDLVWIIQTRLQSVIRDADS